MSEDMSPLDQLSKESDLELIETAIPYVSKDMKKSLALYIKMTEVNNIINGIEDEEMLEACGLDNPNPKVDQMLQAMRLVASPQQAGRLEQMSRMMNMGKMLPSLLAATGDLSGQTNTRNNNGNNNNSNNQIEMMTKLSSILRQQQMEEQSPMNNAWMNDPRVRSISTDKLAILQRFISDNQNKTPEDLIPNLVTMNSQLRANGLVFTREETDLILDILKETMSPADQQRLDMIKNMLG